VGEALAYARAARSCGGEQAVMEAQRLFAILKERCRARAESDLAARLEDG
jgi:hypothetical protein